MCYHHQEFSENGPEYRSYPQYLSAASGSGRKGLLYIPTYISFSWDRQVLASQRSYLKWNDSFVRFPSFMLLLLALVPRHWWTRWCLPTVRSSATTKIPHTYNFTISRQSLLSSECSFRSTTPSL